MPKLLLPILTVLAVGGATAGGATYLLTRDDAVEEVSPPAVQASATPDPAATEPPKATPTAEPTAPPDDWKTYTDPELGFTFPERDEWTGTVKSFPYPAKEGLPEVEVRTLEFRTADGLFALGLALAPNPAGLSLEDWVSTYPGWPGDPSGIDVDGQRALLFPIDQQGQRFPQIYFESQGIVYTVQANVYGHQGAPPALSEEDLQRVIDGFQVPE